MPGKVKIIQGDITEMAVDAIVNAANSGLRRGDGVCGAIHRAAGPELERECEILGGCATGDAKVTSGYKLKARYVIHAVGPIYRDGNSGEPEALASCYRRCFEVAAPMKIRSIAFPSISTGIYGYPIENAVPIVLGTIRDQMERFPEISSVFVVLYSEHNLLVYRSHVREYFPDQGVE